jgi:hypothetical protein
MLLKVSLVVYYVPCSEACILAATAFASEVRTEEVRIKRERAAEAKGVSPTEAGAPRH